MTNVDAVAAKRGSKRVTLAALTALLGFGLGGCETTNNVFGQSGDAGTTLAQPEAAPAPQPPRARIAIAPIIGAPDGISKQLAAQLTSSLESQKLQVSKGAAEPADYTLRGYIVSAKEKSGTKVSYIWDMNDPAGKRVNRITGEEIVTGATGKDPWGSVTPQVVQNIANRTTSSLVASLPAAGQSATGGAAIAATPTQPVQTAATPVSGGTTTASIPKQNGSIMAVVPGVSGAPGDGSQSLSSALQRELSRNGLQLAAAGQPTAYRVEGKVVVGAGKDGKQPIQIDWLVKDPKGVKLGTVSQKNEIPEGSLDGAWGKTADAAAAAAAQGILKLLPQQTQTN